MRQDYYDLKNQENKKLAAGVHVGALCRVEKFDPVAMTVDVQPLSRRWTPPSIVPNRLSWACPSH